MGCQYPCSQTGNLGSLATFMVPGFRQADLAALDDIILIYLRSIRSGIRRLGLWR